MLTGKGFGFDDLKDFVSEATRICAKRQNIKDIGVVRNNATDASAPSKPADKKGKGKQSYADATKDSPPKVQQAKLCRTCGSTGHDTVKCPVLQALPMDQRSEKVREFKLCYGCLLPGHSQRQCQEPPTCGKCGKVGHNEIFCGRKPTPSNRGNNQGANIPRLSANAQSFNPANTTTAPAAAPTSTPVIDIGAPQPSI